MGFLDKAKEVLHENAEKVEQAIDKAGDFIDEKTQASSPRLSTRCRMLPRAPSTRARKL